MILVMSGAIDDSMGLSPEGSRTPGLAFVYDNHVGQGSNQLTMVSVHFLQ